MKRIAAYCFFTFFAFSASAQNFLRGIVRDDKGTALQNVKVFLRATNVQYNTDRDGTFGVNTALAYDSVTFSLDGYETQTIGVKTDSYQLITLKESSDAIIKNRPRLISFTKDKKRSNRFNPFVSDETYFRLIENEFVKTSDYPNTGFSLNINKASYSNVRRFINMDSRVPPDAVRIEELVNYFNLGYEAPPCGQVFSVHSYIQDCPWNSKEQLLFLNVSARKLDLDNTPPGNFVFLIDVSGSMDMANRLALVKAAFQLFVKNLRPIDKVSIVTYGGMVGTWLEPTPGNETERISNALEMLTAAGDTPGADAITAAYKLAVKSFIPGGNNRVILATDGDFNVGPSTEDALEDLIVRERQTGVYLTCLGVGMGNFKDSKLQTLAKKGNGNYAYLDDLHEAEKVLVHELTETLYAVADDAYIDVDFNPALVNSYRLIGFDNKREAIQDASSDLDGGEIGSGASTMAIFEIVPAKADSTHAAAELGVLSLKFHDAADSDMHTQQMLYCIPSQKDSVNRAYQFAAAVAMYGMKLKGSSYLNKASWSDVKNIAAASADKTDFLQGDFLKMVEKTISIYDRKKRKRDE